jgi:ABC-2 type transport system ATP-binding protein
MIINRGRVVFDESLATVNAITTIFAGFRQPPAAGELAAIAGVAGVDALAGGRFSLTPARAADPREAIARTAAERNWALVELRAEQATLEEIFLAKTAGEEVASEEKAA